MRTPKPIPAAPQAYRTAELRAAGIAQSRLRATDIKRAGRGIVLHPDCELDPGVYLDRCIAFGQALQQEFFLSHRSAAVLHGMPVSVPRQWKFDVASFSPFRAPRRSDCIGRRVRSGVIEWDSAHGLTVPSPADTWCQLAAVLPLTGLVAAGDFLISGELILGSGGKRRPPLAPFDALGEAHMRHRGSTGSPLRRHALALLRSPVDSPKESELRIAIVSAGFEEPVVNCPMPVVGRVLHADLGYPDLKIAIDYEGAHHFEDPAQARLDELRRKLLRDVGWVWIRVTAETMRDLDAFFAELAAEIARARLAR